MTKTSSKCRSCHPPHLIPKSFIFFNKYQYIGPYYKMLFIIYMQAEQRLNKANYYQYWTTPCLHSGCIRHVLFIMIPYFSFQCHWSLEYLCSCFCPHFDCVFRKSSVGIALCVYDDVKWLQKESCKLVLNWWRWVLLDVVYFVSS